MSTIITFRQLVKVHNCQVNLTLPDDFAYTEVEVFVMPKAKDADQTEPVWESSDLEEAGKIGLSSSIFPADNEDYSKW